MTVWNYNQYFPVYTGQKANDGTGTDIRDAFIIVDANFANISTYLSNPEISFLGANILNSLTADNAFISNLSVAGAAQVGNLVVSDTTTFDGNVYFSANIVPTKVGIDLGTESQPFGNIYGTVYSTVINTVNLPTVSSGFLSLHSSFDPVSYTVKDVGIIGKYDKNSSNLYAFFGYQASTDNFVYKITPTDHTQSGETEVTDGVYGNVQVGSLFLSNTGVASNALIVSGNVRVGRTVYANTVGQTATIGNLTVGNILGNINVTGIISSGGSPLLTVNTAGPYSLFSGGIVLGNVLIPATYDATSANTAALVVGGGIAVGANVLAGGFLGPYYGTIANANQPNITGVGALGNLVVSYQTRTSTLQVTGAGGIGTTDLTATGNVYITAINGLQNLSTSGNVTANGINSPFIGNTGTNLIGTLSTAAQPAITSVGTLTGLTVSGPTNIMPTGSLLMWATNLAPSGFLLCTGNAVSRTTYASLYSVIGSTFGSGDNSTTFNLPTIPSPSADINFIIKT